MRLTFLLAWRNLFRNTRRTLLTCLLVACSLAALMLTDALILGMLKVMIDSATETFAGELEVHRAGFQDSFDVDLYMADATRLEGIVGSDPQVAGYSVRTVSGGMISSTSTMSGVLLYGVDPAREVTVSRLKEAMIEGRYLSGAPGEILVGAELADLLGVELGDRIVITLAQANGGELAQALFRLSGVFRFGMRELDNNLAFIELGKSREMLGIGEGAHEIAITFANPDLAASADLPLRARLAEASIDVQSWKEFMPQINAMIEMVDYSTFIIGLILFILAALGVINSMFMSIYERIYEFGVIRAIGTTPRQIVQLIMAEALLLGILSLIGGLLLGGLSSWYCSYHGIPMGEYEFSGISIPNSIRTVLSLDQFTHFPLYVLLLTLAAAIYPARYAARIVPSLALQRTL